jgi:hypothetical protein
MSEDTAKTLTKVAGILLIVIGVILLPVGVLFLIYAFPAAMLASSVGQYTWATSYNLLGIASYVFIGFGVCDLILGVLCISWRNNPASNTLGLIIAGILGCATGFGLGAPAIVAHFMSGSSDSGSAYEGV